jgi:predicted AAA+ superfamily ATPase
MESPTQKYYVIDTLFAVVLKQKKKVYTLLAGFFNQMMTRFFLSVKFSSHFESFFQSHFLSEKTASHFFGRSIDVDGDDATIVTRSVLQLCSCGVCLCVLFFLLKFSFIIL